LTRRTSTGLPTGEQGDNADSPAADHRHQRVNSSFPVLNRKPQMDTHEHRLKVE
jgi:hypothetical protein